MEHVIAIQRVVDDQREQMPTGAVTAIMEHAQKLYDDKSKLYRVHMTHIHSVGYMHEDGLSSKLIQSSTTSIVESVDCYPEGAGILNRMELLKAGKIRL